MQRTALLGLLAVVCFLTITSVAGCGELLDPGGGTGTLKVLITDAPFPLADIEYAKLTITRIEARCAGGDEEDTLEESGPEPGAQTVPTDNTETESADEGNAEDPCPWVVVYDAEEDEEDDGRTFDLLDLQNGRTDLLAEADIPAGTYTQLRLIVTEGEIKLYDQDEPFHLRVPSGEQTGIKLHLTFTVAPYDDMGDTGTEAAQTAPQADPEPTEADTADDDGITVLLLDVDLTKLFQPIGGTNPDDISGFHFRPSVAMRLITMSDAGTVSGTVTDAGENALADVVVTAFATNAADDDGVSTITEGDGTYVLILPAGSYNLEFHLGEELLAEITDVEVEAGKDTDVDFMLAAPAVP